MTRDEILAKLVALPVSTWNYKWDDDSVRHMGPMAQDFHAAFGLGGDDTVIVSVDAIGVLIVAVQALVVRVESLEARLPDGSSPG